MINEVFQIQLSFFTAGLTDCFLQAMKMKGKPVHGGAYVCRHTHFHRDKGLSHYSTEGLIITVFIIISVTAITSALTYFTGSHVSC